MPQKTEHFQTFIQRLNTFIFANIYHSPCDTYQVLNIEAPYFTTITRAN
jgi:hypothetical protein